MGMLDGFDDYTTQDILGQMPRHTFGEMGRLAINPAILGKWLGSAAEGVTAPANQIMGEGPVMPSSTPGNWGPAAFWGAVPSGTSIRGTSSALRPLEGEILPPLSQLSRDVLTQQRGRLEDIYGRWDRSWGGQPVFDSPRQAYDTARQAYPRPPANPPRLTPADYNVARTQLPADASLADRTAAAMRAMFRRQFPNANDAFIEQQMAGWRSAGSPSSYSPAPRSEAMLVTSREAKERLRASLATGPSGQLTPGGAFNAQGQYVPPPPFGQPYAPDITSAAYQRAAQAARQSVAQNTPGSPAPSAPAPAPPQGGYLNPGSSEQGILPGVLRMSPEELYQHLYGRTAPPPASRGYGPYQQTTLPAEAPLGQFVEPPKWGPQSPARSSPHLMDRLAAIPTARRPTMLPHEMPLSEIKKRLGTWTINYEPGGNVEGQLYAYHDPTWNKLRISSSELPSSARGQGIGQEMYRRMFDEAFAQDPPLEVISDSIQSHMSHRLYPKFAEEGYSVQKSPLYHQMSGGQYPHRADGGIWFVGPKEPPLGTGEPPGPFESRYLAMLKKSPHMLAPFAGVPLGATLLQPGDDQQ